MPNEYPTPEISDSTLNCAWRSNVYFDRMQAAKAKLALHNGNTAFRGSALLTRELKNDFMESERIFKAEVNLVGVLLKRDGLLPQEVQGV